MYGYRIRERPHAARAGRHEVVDPICKVGAIDTSQVVVPAVEGQHDVGALVWLQKVDDLLGQLRHVDGGDEGPTAAGCARGAQPPPGGDQRPEAGRLIAQDDGRQLGYRLTVGGHNEDRITPLGQNRDGVLHHGQSRAAGMGHGGFVPAHAP